MNLLRSQLLALQLFVVVFSCAISASFAEDAGVLLDKPPVVAEGASDALADYLAKPDESYAWEKMRGGKVGESEYVELILTSQKWRETLWKHRLFIIKPKTVGANRQTMLVIAGGRWDKKFEDPDYQEHLSGQAALFAEMAERLKSPVAVLLQVPQQPLFDGLVEDEIIALSFDRFLSTRDAEWLLLLPMVKSAVRAMDAVQEFAREEWALEVDAFTVTGASKRGWTTWLLGAVDRRATALAPMVIDMLNMGPQMRHQQEVWGGLSEKLGDYTRRNLLKQLDTPPGRALQRVVDPFAYRRRLDQPKLIILGTNDRYWPVDALNFYWDDLTGQKHILYVPNNRHGLRDLPRLSGGLMALHEQARGGKALPKLTWHFDQQEAAIALQAESDEAISKFQVWTATSAMRDFREARWSAAEVSPYGGAFGHTVVAPASGYRALFGEAVYEREDYTLYLSTSVQIVIPTEK